ncbi:c-type cytochrome [Sphingobacterium sp. 18053]|uniref:c-type cytochrome n=1 Tax=Sphingobacterium sp. 18053 TaxID=2681401 RepID=UPI00135CE997|nr:c-type cytochrome [Sphingobacterium sp. 18053]
MKIVKYLVIILGVVLLFVVLAGTYVRFTKPDIGPAPVLRIEQTATRIERGKYLSNHVAVCMDCHSKRDWSSFSGPIVPGTLGGGGEKFGKEAGFPGTIYSTNLTPYQLSSWTDGEIYRAVTSGVGKDGRALFPVMGYHRFGQMDKEDIYSIIAYIRTLPVVKTEVPPGELDFPINLLNRLSPVLAAHQPLPSPRDTVKYGAYLINAAGCVDCHSKQDKGKIVPGTEFAGGMEFKQPNGVVRAPNITMDPNTGIGNWTEELFVSRFKIYADSNYRLHQLLQDELNSPMPWKMYAGMSPEDVKAIYRYLKSLPPKVSPIQVRSYGH